MALYQKRLTDLREHVLQVDPTCGENRLQSIFARALRLHFQDEQINLLSDPPARVLTAVEQSFDIEHVATANLLECQITKPLA